MSTSVLELNIATMLDDGALVSSADVALMIEQVEGVIAVAEKMAAAEETKALDLTKSPDANKARAAMEETAFARDRLKAVLPKLQQQYATAYAAEEAVKLNAEHARIKAMVVAEAGKFARCRALMEQLAERFASAKAIDEEVSRFNISSPPGYHIDGVEATARNLQISAHAPSVIDKTVLQTWEPGGRSLWPPPRDPAVFAQLFAPVSDNGLSFPGGDWWRIAQEKNRQLLARAEAANR